MTLSGWTRLWIVGAVLWWAVGAYILLPQFPTLNAYGEYMLDACRSGQDAPGVSCDIVETIYAEAIKQAWWDLAPSLVLWIAGPLAVWAAWRWVLRGFVTAKKDSSASL